MHWVWCLPGHLPGGRLQYGLSAKEIRDEVPLQMYRLYCLSRTMSNRRHLSRMKLRQNGIVSLLIRLAVLSGQSALRMKLHQNNTVS